MLIERNEHRRGDVEMEREKVTIPYLQGKYYGDEVLEWLKENMKENQYKIIKHPIAIQLSSGSYPTRYAFHEEVDAVAFKLRWGQ